MAIQDQNSENLEGMNQQLDDIQKPRKVGVKVGLGVIHEDLTKLEKTIKGDAPKAGRSELPRVSLGKQSLDPNDPKNAKLIEMINAQMGAAEAAAPEAETPAPTAEKQAVGGESDKERTARLQKIGGVIQEKIGAERGGTLNTSQTATNSKVFETFIAQTKQREELLKTASDDQKEIFSKLEETLVKLREANKDESDKLRQTLGELSGQLKETENSPAKEKIGRVLSTAQEQAQPVTKMGIFNTLRGKEQQLKPGFVKEGDQIRNTETGKFASGKEATEGKVAASAKMMGNFLINKLENHIENKYGEKITGQRAASKEGPKSSELGAILKALQGMKPGKTKGPNRSSTEREIRELNMPGAKAAVAASSTGLGNITAEVLNVKAGTVNIDGGKGKNKDSEEEESGGILDMLGFGKSKPAVAGARTTSKAAGAKTAAPVKGKAAVRTRDAKGRFTKAPVAGASKLGTAAKVGGKALGALGVGLAGYNAYDENKDRGTAAAAGIAGTTMGGALGGAAAGAAIGTMIFPGVGTVAGGLIGGALGAFGGQAAGEAGADALGATKPSAVTAVPKIQGQTIAAQTATNRELTKADNKPIVIPVPAAAAPAAAQGNNQSMMLPRGDMRPTENAYDRYVNRGTSFV